MKDGASVLDIDTDKLTPGMKQYQEVKKAHPDCLVMLRMGDFYEMFYEDAVTAAKELEITLTARGKDEKRAPLAGVPYHALETYLGRLVKKGYKVAIVEQLEDPAKAKGLVKRGLVRIVTPGTVIESSFLPEKENNFIMGVTVQQETAAIALCDMSTGEFFTYSVQGIPALYDELLRCMPSECIIPESLRINSEIIEKIKASGGFVNSVDDYYFQPERAKQILLHHFNVASLDSYGLEKLKLNTAVSGALLHYLLQTQKNSLSHLTKIALKSGQNMLLDGTTLRNLELVKNMRDGSLRGTLLSVLDKTVTPMGARLLRNWIKAPLLQTTAIMNRLAAVEELQQNVIARTELISLLQCIYDIERLISRINYGNANPRDLLSLKQSLQQIPLIRNILSGSSAELLQVCAAITNIDDIVVLIEQAIREDAPITIREGGMIKVAFHQELAELQSITQNSKKYLQQLEEQERQKTGIQTIKIGYTRVFGYFIEITKKNVHLVPQHYIRKQTTANSERYITEELKQEEEKILNAEECSIELEYTLFQDILKEIAAKTNEIQRAAEKIAVLDVLCSLAVVAAENNYTKPEFVERRVIQITKGRHPVLEKLEQRFVPNTIMLDEGEMMIITGPNMAGKSSIMRQTALIIILAQMGSFVPAGKAVLGIVDRIFTRVGAADDLSSGQSTFMMEMNETAAILHSATEHSFIVLDEIGRGTSTFDGVSLAWSVAEHIYQNIKAKTLFATHYHVLNKLAEQCLKVKNYTVAVKEVQGEVVFLHALIPGSTDQSYGIHVAKLAGLPSVVVERAKEIQSVLEKDDEMMRKMKVKKINEQMSLEKF